MCRRPAAGSSRSSGGGSRAAHARSRRCGSGRAAGCPPAGRSGRQADALDLTVGFREQVRLVGTVEAEDAGASTPARPRRCAPSATFSSTVMSGTSLTCWKVRATPAADVACGGELPTLTPRAVIVPPVVVRDAGDQVEGRALAGAVGSDQGDDLAGLHVEGHVVDRNEAAELLAGLVDLHQRRRRSQARARAWRVRRRVGGLRAGLGSRRAMVRPQPVARQLQQHHQQDAEHDGFELPGRRTRPADALKGFLQDHHDPAPTTAPQT